MTHIVRHQFNYEPPEGEINTLPSLTVPDDSMSIEEILKRFASGLPINGNNQEQFYEEEELPNLRAMDLEEIAQMQMEVQEKINAYRKYKADEETQKYRQSIIDDYEKQKPPVPAGPPAPSAGGAGA